MSGVDAKEVMQLIGLIVLILTSVGGIITAFWKLNTQIKLMKIELAQIRTEFRGQIELLAARVEKTEKLDGNINKKLNLIGANIAAILKKLNMKQEKDFFGEDK
jgi:hypothetical protein